MNDKNNKASAFDIIVTETLREFDGSDMLEVSLSPDSAIDVKNRVPLRYRIIALGFLRQYSLDELNGKLRDEGCAALYARSLWEASLIYAFSHESSYKEWKSLYSTCVEFREKQGVEDRYFRSATIGMRELEKYVQDNSADERGAWATRHMTRMLEDRIVRAGTGRSGFTEFLLNNAEAFSPVREKTRYYFCKYLYYMLRTRIDRYTAYAGSGKTPEHELSDLSVFKGISALGRKKYSPEEAEALLMDASVSCGGIFDAFNYYYFEYVSLDWMQVLLEYYGNLNKMSLPDKHKLAGHLRRYDPGRYRDISDDEAIDRMQEYLEENEDEMDRIYSLDGADRGYQRNRAGENAIRKYIKGLIDIDRTTLICFLLFFDSCADLAPADRITRERLTDILLECGFPGLRYDEDDFDCFVVRYLEAADPTDVLMQEVTRYSFSEENFYLYRVYQASSSYSDEFEKLNESMI